MGLAKGIVFRKWTKEEEEFLIKNYSKMDYPELKNNLIRTRDAIKMKVQSLCRLGVIPKSEMFKKLIESQFKKGHVPANKGVKGIYYSGCEKGWFKKGGNPPNTLYDGAVRLRHGHPERNEPPYLYIRVAEGKWELLHRYNWVKAFGPIPEGFIVVFKNGDSLNCNIENLELISKKQNARRNHNPLKSAITNRENRAQFKDLENSEYVVKLITRDENLRDKIREIPEIIELKKIQLIINRNIKNGLAKKAG